jgi:hypothetical protein
MSSETQVQNPDDPQAIRPSYRRKLQAADRLGIILTSAPKWIALAVVAWQARLSIEALAGKTAAWSFLLRFDRQTTSWEVVCWVAGLAGVLYGLYSRILRHRQRMHQAVRR